MPPTLIISPSTLNFLENPVNREDVIRYAVKLFYPEAEYPCSTPGVTYELANFKQEPVSHLVDFNGKEHEFTVQKYCEVSRTHQFNLYLLVRETAGEADKEDEEGDKDLLKSIFDSPTPVEEDTFDVNMSDAQPVNLQGSIALTSSQAALTQDSSPICTSIAVATVGNELSPNWNLIGTSSNRLQLLEEQQSAFEESLKVDQEKEVKRREAAERQQSLESLRSARLSRVPPEPQETSSSPNVRISIRHPTIGAVSRSFLRRESMFAVYDWCGSLSLEPEFFSLYTALPRTFISPTEPVTLVEGTMLYVEEQASPVSLSNDELEVSLRGFGLARDNTIFSENYETFQAEDNAHLPVGRMLHDQSR